jgi:hypothetical protein
MLFPSLGLRQVCAERPCTQGRRSCSPGAQVALSPGSGGGGRGCGLLFGFCRLAGLRGALGSRLREGAFKNGADVFGLVGVALFHGEPGEGLVLLGTDVGSGQLGSALSLVRHGYEKQGKTCFG